ncbi:hypothetical protein [Capnocytophaga sputigena]|uniref:DUF3945 domain-containing protein n=2 Tax=Capnocytophaga sputigena TaxID=1019 RepID=A0AAX2IEQ9_CAPSP|nr:hypothetical protein [Capnocytophaga sputigena]SQA76540.1 Uncharacterised protein [Capnocytophaga sputigena]
MQDIQISIGQQFYSKDYDETLQVHSIREQPNPKIYLSGTSSNREVTLYKSDIVRLLNEERLKEVNTPKKSLNTDILNSFMGDLAWGNDTEMNRLKQVYLSFSPQERDFVDKNAVREGANSIEEVFEKVLSKDEKEKLENKINNFLNTVKQMETTEQKEAKQQPTIDLQIGQKLHYQEDVFEVTKFAKDKNGQDMVILKDPSIGSGIEIPWYRSKLEEVINNGQYKLAEINPIKQMNTAEQEVAEKFKEMPKELYPLAKAYALSEDQEFDNYNADWGNTKSDKIEAYKALKQNFPEEVVKSVEKMVDDNTYTQSKEVNKVYVANIVGILDNIEQQQSQNNDVKVGQKFQFKESNSVLEVVKIDKNAHRDGSDELTMKPIGVNVGNQEFNWSKLALDTAIKEGKVVEITQQQAQSSPQLSEQQSNQLNYLKNQVKYLGLGEDTKLHKNLENAILSPEDKVTVRADYNYPDRLMKGNTVSFDLNLTKTEQGGVFLNSYRANLTTKNGEERSQTFKVQKENNITAKEAINLLEGRSVKIEHDVVNKETGELSRTESFIKLNMKEPKTDYGNYKYEWYNKNAYGVDIDNIMQKSNLTFANDIERERTKKHLEKGNITQVTFQQENRQIQGFAVLNPQWKMLNLYDSTMNRLTIQNQLVKPEVTQSQQKNNVPEHSISR